MRKLNVKYKKSKNTINKMLFVVFFCVILCSIFLFNSYSKSVSNKSILLIDEKTNKILYQFFSDLITDEVINKNTVGDVLEIVKNSKGEILAVNYNLEKTYKVLTVVSDILTKSINNLENGKIDVKIYDKYLSCGKKGLVFNMPLFYGSNNILLNNLGPRIPVLLNFNETLLTNIKTKVTDYGLNNALLEIYITVEMNKLIITPVQKKSEKFYYDILIGALVVNGSVPNFYGKTYENSSGILDIPMT